MEPRLCPAPPARRRAGCHSRDISACPLLPPVTTPWHPWPWRQGTRAASHQAGAEGPLQTRPPQQLLAWLPPAPEKQNWESWEEVGRESGAGRPRAGPKSGAGFARAQPAQGQPCRAAEQLRKPVCCRRSRHQCNQQQHRPGVQPQPRGRSAPILTRKLPAAPTASLSLLSRPCKRWWAGFCCLTVFK